MDEQASVLLVDDHPIFREGLRRVLEEENDLKVIGEAETAAEALEVARRQRPDIVLLDLRLQDGSGLEALPRLIQECPACRVIVISGQGEEHAIPALRLGARGFVSKDTASAELVLAIRAVRRGEIWAEQRVTTQLLGDLLRTERERHGEQSLTPREQGVLRMVGEGRRNAEIAEALFISNNTVKTHISSLMRKLGIEDRVQLALYASRRHWGGD
jgi:DNA-binding NarL/FixJ family response regulator